MKNNIRIILGIFALSSLVGCGNSDSPKFSQEELNQNAFKLAMADYDLASNTGDKAALTRAISALEKLANIGNSKAIIELKSLYYNTGNEAEYKHWSEVEVIAKSNLYNGRIKGSLLVGNRDLAIRTSVEALAYMQLKLAEVKKLDANELIDIVNNVLENVDEDKSKYDLMCNLAIFYIYLDTTKNRKIIEKLLNDAFAKEYFFANNILVSYYLDNIKDVQLAKNTLDRRFHPKLLDGVLQALIKNNQADEAYAYFKKHIAVAPESSMDIMIELCGNDDNKLFDLLKTRFMAVQDWQKSPDFAKHLPLILKYTNANSQDASANYMTALAYEMSNNKDKDDLVLKYLEKSASLGYGLAYMELADLCVRTHRNRENADSLNAFEYYKKAEEAGITNSVVKQKELLDRITSFEGSTLLEKANAKFNFYKTLQSIGVAGIDTYIEKAIEEQKFAFVAAYKISVAEGLEKMSSSMTNLNSAKNVIEKAFKEGQSQMFISTKLSPFSKYLNSLELSFNKLSGILDEAESYNVEFFTKDENIKKAFEEAKTTIATEKANLAKFKDGSYSQESEASSIFSDNSTGAPSTNLEENAAIIKAWDTQLSSLKTKLAKLYSTMLRASGNQRVSESKTLLKELSFVKPEFAKYNNAIAGLALSEGINKDYIEESRQKSIIFADYLNKLEEDGKKNSETALDSLLKSF
ncbi:MAG: hypothetical protein R3Y46_07330 [Opitutales bacterium]